MATNDFRYSTSILTKDQLAAIGSVAVESTFCEHLVEVLIWSLSGMDEPQGKYFTQGIQLNNRLDLLTVLGKQKLNDEKEMEEFTKIISQLKLANNDRNSIIHGHWRSKAKNMLMLLAMGPEGFPPATATKRRLNSEPLKFSATQIEATAVKIANLHRELLKFSTVAWNFGA
jgi:hypothetical protein